MSVVAERVGATRKRLAELRERMDRLRAGEPPSSADVERAQAAARAQQESTRRAYVRLLDARAAAAAHAPTRARTAGSGDQQGITRLARENQRLSDALVAIQTYSPQGLNWADERRRWMWKALVDECRSANWRSWSMAICAVAPRLIPAVRGAALTLYDENHTAHPLAANNPWARDIEEIQEIVGEGPALEVSPNRRSVVVDDITTAYARWPVFVEAAAAAGLQSLFTFFLPLGQCITGSLTLYGTVPASLDDTSTIDMALLADVAASALLADVDALNDADAGDIAWHDEYQDVHIAAGMLSVQLRVSVPQAYAELRAHAYGNGHSLSDTAKAVIRGTFRPG